jgi:hypothetical protein
VKQMVAVRPLVQRAARPFSAVLCFGLVLEMDSLAQVVRRIGYACRATPTAP